MGLGDELAALPCQDNGPISKQSLPPNIHLLNAPHVEKLPESPWFLGRVGKGFEGSKLVKSVALPI